MKPLFHRGRPNRRCRKRIKMWDRHERLQLITAIPAPSIIDRNRDDWSHLRFTPVEGAHGYLVYRDRGPSPEEIRASGRESQGAKLRTLESYTVVPL